MMKTIRILFLLFTCWILINSAAAQDIEIFQQYFNQYASMLNTLSDVEGEDIEDRRMFKYRILKEYFDPEKSVISNHLPRGGSRDLLAKEYLDNLLVDYSSSIQHSIEVKGMIHTSLSKPIIHIQHRLSGSVNTASDLQVVLDIKNYSESSLFATIRSISFYKVADGKAERERRAEASAWASAERSDTKAGYEGYLADYPDGAHARQARSKINDIEALERAEAERRRAASKSPAENAAEEIASTMVNIPGGTFTMGCTSEQGDDCGGDERPAHEVYVSGFELNKYEVTQAQWREIMGSDPDELYNSGCDRCPVEKVSWNDAQKFIRELNRISGANYRLPTEAEWEYAARGGQQSRGYKYSGSDRIYAVAWYDANAKARNNHGSKGTTRPVGGKRANELGLYDMSGNVWEWCSDWYEYGYYEASPRNNPGGPSSGYERVLRGGSWDDRVGNCRVSYRYFFFSPGIGINDRGFRLAR